MKLFIDTSAFLAVLNADDAYHKKAKQIWSEIITRENTLVSTNYILLETIAILQRRLGIQAVRTFQEDIAPILTIEWISEEMHSGGITALITSAKRDLSLVDCISFEIMRQLGLKDVFAFDSHFKDQGFNLIL